jgi:O-antigen/teichoic acid export membrane protein
VGKITPSIDVIADLHENIKVIYTLKIIIQYGAPIYFSAIIHTLRGQFQKILLTMYALNTEIGNYQTAMNFTFIMTSILVTLYNSLLPSFSKLNIKIDRESLIKIYKLSVKYSSLIIIPISIAFIAFSQPLILILYGDQFNTASLYLSLYALNFLYVGLGRYNYGVLLHSQAQTKISLKINIISFIISIPFILYLIPIYGVLGVIISMYIYNFINTISGLYVIKKEYNILVNIMSFLKILISSFISYGFVVYLHSYLKNEILKIILGGFVYLFALMLFSPLVGAINEGDLHTIDRSSSGIPILNLIFKPILKIEMLLIRFMKSFS